MTSLNISRQDSGCCLLRLIGLPLLDDLCCLSHCCCCYSSVIIRGYRLIPELQQGGVAGFESLRGCSARTVYPLPQSTAYLPVFESVHFCRKGGYIPGSTSFPMIAISQYYGKAGCQRDGDVTKRYRRALTRQLLTYPAYHVPSIITHAAGAYLYVEQQAAARST